MRLMIAVRCSTNPWRTRCTLSWHCCSRLLIGTKRMFGRPHRFADRRGVGGVVVATLAGQTIRGDECRADALCGHEQACPVVRAGARFRAEAWRSIRQLGTTAGESSFRAHAELSTGPARRSTPRRRQRPRRSSRRLGSWSCAKPSTGVCALPLDLVQAPLECRRTPPHRHTCRVRPRRPGEDPRSQGLERAELGAESHRLEQAASLCGARPDAPAIDDRVASTPGCGGCLVSDRYADRAS